MNNEEKLKQRKKHLKKQIEKREKRIGKMLTGGSMIANFAELAAGKILKSRDSKVENNLMKAPKKKKNKKSKLQKATPLIIQAAAIAAGFFLAKYAAKKLFQNEDED